MNEEFVDLLKLEYEEIKLGISKASLEGKGTPQEIADRREELFHTFFRKYFPFPYRVTKGNIVDSYNKRSASIDCIILSPCHPHTIDPKNNKASIIFADGVDFAIEIKGALCDKKEIERALYQIKTVKELTKRNTSIIFEKDRNEHSYKISTILYADKTYSNIETLIETILNYYKENKIKRLHQFDIIIAGEYIIINSCKGQISFNNIKGIIYEKTEKNTLAVLLFLMANMPISQSIITENIYNIYLDNILSNGYYDEKWNKILDDIEKS